MPAYNSELSLPLLASRIQPVLETLATDYELILVDDASSDGTWSVIEGLARDHTWIRGVHFMRNYGQHNAVLCGIRMARYDVTVTLDDDLQHPPEEIPKLLEKLTQDTDVVYGSPAQETHGLWRDMASQVTKIALQSAMGAPIARKAGPFRAPSDAKEYYPAVARDQLARMEKERKALEDATPDLPKAMGVREGEKIADLPIHIRGSHWTLGQEAPRRFLRVVAGDNQPPIPPQQSGRLQFAEWLAEIRRPEVARDQPA